MSSLPLPSCKLENGCDALLKYYNTSILNHPNMDPALKEACYAEAKECADKNFARANGSLPRTVLAELILSHQNQQDQTAKPDTKKPYADFIAGPLSLTLQWSSYYKKLIYIFGEKHDKEYDCPEPIPEKTTMLVENYIKQLYINGDMFCDVYDETGAFFKNQQSYTYPYTFESDRIDGIRNHFTQCLLDANLDENCRKGRVHYFDIRLMTGMDDDYGNISNFTRKYMSLDGKKNQEYIDSLNVFFTDKQVLQMIQDVDSYSSPKELMRYLKTEFDDNYLFKKELRNSFMKDKINSFIDENIKKFNILFKTIIEDIHKLMDTLENYTESDETKTYQTYNFDVLKVVDVDGDNYRHLDFLRKLLDRINNYLIRVETLLADGYLLARVFKKFNIDDEKVTKQRLTDEPDEPRNIVIYAGDNHSIMYREFLKKKLGFKLIAVTGKDWRDKHSENEYENCISMEDFPQPFFEYHKDVNWLEDASSDTKPSPDKNWSKIKSATNGRYYYANPTRRIRVWKRPVDYSSDEDEDVQDM